MSEFLDRISKLSPKRLALLALELQTRVGALEGSAPEPLAVVGLGCRFPGGADSPAAFWELLRRGADAITEVPRDRWDVDAYYDPDPDASGKMATRFGGFLRDVDRFDAQFFGITPREAASMDPQQRLLLEVAWEALEDAGQAPDALTGSATGVFVGMCNADYFHRIVRGDPSGLDAYIATGGAHSVAAGRLAYVLGLQGPNLAIDTACSSSLVAVHLACQSLRSRECRMALAGGVNLILAPETTIILSRAHMMAPDGRCKAFDARADGFVRAEGCGLVVLKRLSDAEADGDTVLAVIRGTAINQDGRSNGLTAPNGPAQEAVLRSALANAGIAPHEVAYVEAHGTGTSLGDPIEMRALGTVLGTDRPGVRPLIVGSLKTNIGHLEAAAGVAGLIKVILALRQGEIPRQLHFQTPNPHIPWSGFPVTIATEALAWPEGRRIAGVSSFGFSGTNAHILLEAAPDRTPAHVSPSVQRHVLTLSARGEAALRELAGRWAECLAQPPASLEDLCATASIGRAQLEHRLAIPARSAEEGHRALSQYAAGREAAGVVVGRAPKTAPDVVFLFPGQGAQYTAMGGGLYEQEPVFRAALDRCAAAARRTLDLPLLEVLYGRAADALEQTAYTQVGLFAVEWALAEVWRARGVRPSLVLGHSVGEYAAACVAGVLDVEAAVELVAARGRLMGALRQGGAMAAVHADEPTVAGIVAGTGLAIAAVNGPESVVVSGEAGALEGVLIALKARSIQSQRLRVTQAFHSPLMEPMLEAFRAEARRVQYMSPRISLVSTATGQIVEAGELGAEYWVRQVREPVRYAAALAAARAAGGRLFIELGPQPVLTGLGQPWLEGAIWVPTLRRGQDDREMLLQAIGRAWVHGVGIDWRDATRERGARRVAGLPTYPFQRERHWLDPAPALRAEAGHIDRRSTHPLVGARVRSAVPSPQFESCLDVRELSFLADHRIHGLLIAPSPLYLEMAAAASTEVMGHDTTLSDFTIEHPMVFVDGGPLVVQTVVNPRSDGSAIVEIVSADHPEAPAPVWRVHARATACRRDASVATDGPSIEPHGMEEIAASTYYEHLRARGLDFGPAFRGIERVWRGTREALAEVRVPDLLRGQSHPYRIHPAILDACLQVLGAAWPEDDQESYLLTGAERVEVVTTGAERLRVHATLRAREQGELVIGDLRVFDDRGAVVADLRGIHLRRARAESLARYRSPTTDDWLYEVAWPASPLVGASRWGPLVSPRDIVRRLDAEVAAVAATEGLGRYDDLLPSLESLSYHYVLDVLTRLGWLPQPGDHVSAGSLTTSLGIEPKYQRLVGRFLEILAEEGALRSIGDVWEVLSTLPRGDAEASARRLTERFPDAPELALTVSCGRALGDVLRGRADPLQLLFSPTAFATTERLYTASPGARTYNTLVAHAIRMALEHRPPGRRVRILEIGAGTGGTTAAILAELPADAVEYVFTDVSPAFTARAAETFTAPFLTFRTLDIERQPDQQGFAGERFDIVLAANVLHATRDLRQSLAHVGHLLEGHGLLILLEGTARQRWVDLTFGLTEGWWRFTDVDLRPTHALLRAEQWLTLLEASGLVEPGAVPFGPASRALSTQAVLLARAAGRERPIDGAGARVPRDWLVLADRGGIGGEVAATFEARGDRTTIVYAPDDITALVQRADEAGRPWHGVIHLWSLDSVPPSSLDRVTVEAEVMHGCESVVELVRALAPRPGAPSARLWLVTRGAQAIGMAEPEPVAVTQAPLWGLGRVVALEHPDRWGGIIDVDPRAPTEVSAGEIVTHIQIDDGEDQVGFRAGDRYVPRLSRRAPAGSARPIVCADGAYLVTGGLGTLGLQVARWLAEQGARDLVLIGRRGLPPRSDWVSLAPDSEPGRQTAAVVAIEALGARVRVVAGDVTDPVAMTALFATFGGGAPRLRGIVHAAAGLRAEKLEQMQPETLAAVLGPKVTGAWLLHELSRDLDLDFFVFFSSTTALLGSGRLGAYAAANQFLDGLAHHRRHAGQSALSINWGTWDQMQVSEEDRRGFVQTGLLPMPAPDALATLGQLLADPSGQVAVAAVDWGALTSVYEARRRRPFLERLAASAERPIRSPHHRGAADLIARVNAAAPDSRSDLLLGYVREQVGAVLRLDPMRIDVEQGLFDMGMDSLMALDVKTRLETAVDRRLPSTVIFNYPTVTALAAYLASELLAGPLVGASSARPDDKREPSRHEPQTRDDLSEEELAAMLTQKLEKLR
ncbi:MAG TPA: type I polyketide synthase [Methylomirabilota bacterium]|nr:type I polyketide synthase [Methylomirabilota bacterium]